MKNAKNRERLWNVVRKAIEDPLGDEGEATSFDFQDAFWQLEFIEDDVESLVYLQRKLHEVYGDSPNDAAVQVEKIIVRYLVENRGVGPYDSETGMPLGVGYWRDALSEAAGTSRPEDYTLTRFDYNVLVPNRIAVEREAARVIIPDGGTPSLYISGATLSNDDRKALLAVLNRHLPPDVQIPEFSGSPDGDFVTVHPLYDLVLSQSYSVSRTTTPEILSAELGVTKSLRSIETKRIYKAAGEEDERIVGGEILVPDEVDAQGDIYSAEEVRKAAYKWIEETGGQFAYLHSMLDGQLVGRDKMLVLENVIEKADVEVPTFDGGTRLIKKGTWSIVARVNDDDLWSKIKSGELTGFSIGAYAIEVDP